MLIGKIIMVTHDNLSYINYFLTPDDYLFNRNLNPIANLQNIIAFGES